MAWSTWTPAGTLTSVRLGVLPIASINGVIVTGRNSVDLIALLESPMTSKLVELSDQRLVAIGSAPDFPVTPKWRKVVRTIG